MKPREKTKTLFKRYLITYSAVFCIPCALFLVIFNFYFMQIYKEDVIQNHQERSSRIGLTVDWQMEQLHSLVTQLMISDVYRPGAATDTLHQLEMVQELRTLKSSNELIYNINYYQKNLRSIISSSNVIETATFERFHFRYKNWGKEEMLQFMYNLSERGWRPFEPVVINDKYEMQLMTFYAPFTLSPAYNARSIQIQIRQDAFERMMGFHEAQTNMFIILDENGEVFYHHGALDDMLLEALSQAKAQVNVPEKMDDGNWTLEMGNYLLCGAPSNVNNWYYINAMPLDIALEKTRAFQFTFLMFAAGIFALGVLITYFISRLSYKPIGELWELLANNNLPINEAPDEISKAKETISYLSQFSLNLEHRLEQTSGHVREALVYGLLQGKYRTTDAFNQEGKPYGLLLHGQLFFTVIVSASAGSEMPRLAVLERNIGKKFEVMGVESFDAAHTVLVCGVSHGPKERVYEEFLELIKEMGRDTAAELAFGVSTMATDLSTLYSKYIEAVSALEYIDTAKSPVSFYGYGRDLSTYSMRYPNEEIDILRQCLREENGVRFQHTFSILFKYVENPELSVFMRICVCFDVINTMIKVLMDMQEDASTNDFFLQISKQSIGRQNDFSWHIRTMKLLHEHITARLGSKSAKEETLLEAIMNAIHTHYLEDSFNVQWLADKFSMNISNLSTYFKGKTNITLIQYITSLKMNYAVEMLKAGDLSLTDLAQKTGYSSVSSFIRKFKQYTGTTPGEYKKVYEDENQIEK